MKTIPLDAIVTTTENAPAQICVAFSSISADNGGTWWQLKRLCLFVCLSRIILQV